MSAIVAAENSSVAVVFEVPPAYKQLVAEFPPLPPSCLAVAKSATSVQEEPSQYSLVAI